MAKDSSFDVYAKVDLQEVNNAIDQSVREITNRYDFKGSKSEITLNQKDQEISLLGDDDYKLKALKEILETKLIKRGISIRALDYQKETEASGGMVRQIAKIQSGISIDKCKEIVKYIKTLKMKVQSSIQSDLVRVSGKSKDDLQTLMEKLKEKDFGIFMQFGNYR